MYCNQCGNKLDSNAKFCPNCGAKVGEKNTENNARVSNCPNCGHPISAVTASCPACGYEIRSKGTLSATKEFLESYDKISQDREGLISGIVNLVNGNISGKTERLAAFIRNFAVPYTKEDVYEFMLLASSHFSEESISNSTDQNEKTILIAWKDKFYQVYEKAKIALQDRIDFMPIQELYEKKHLEIDVLKKKAKRKKVYLVVLIILCLSIMVTPILVAYIRYEKKETELNQVLSEVHQDILSGAYESASLKANTLYMDMNWSKESTEKWDSIRQSLIEEIENAKQQQLNNP